jgi:predicted PurR-regulated permease PerM
MAENENSGESGPVTRSTRRELREKQQLARRVFLDPSSPSVISITRVVILTLLLLFIFNRLESIIVSLTSLFFLVVLSIFFAYLIDPLVKLIRRPFKKRHLDKLMPRSVAIVIAYLIVFTVLGVAISSLAPRVVDQAKEFGTNLPNYGIALQERVNDLNRRFDRLKIPDEVQADLTRRMAAFGETITAAFGGFLLGAAVFTPWLILVPILSFFFLKDVNMFRLSVLRMFPAGRWRARAEAVMSDVNVTLAAYTRAQLISCCIIGVICTIGFYLIGLKYALLLGIVAGICEFVPLIGPITIGLVVTLVAAFSDKPWRALYIIIFLAVLRIIHDYVTYPRIVREGIHLHPLAIILSVLAGEQVAGIPGVFLSIPIVAIVTVLYKHVLEHSGKSGFFSGWLEPAEPEKKIET